LILLGVGLNLTRANNVISLDLGWSQAVESQAFDRVHRVGQMRKVHVQRVVIADTVEDRILKMQERKVLLAFVECFRGRFSHSLFSANSG
jgi:SNF2 family DNA or RNA helicase